jgi:tetratricopeptide (TPR) repeat protein
MTSRSRPARCTADRRDGRAAAVPFRCTAVVLLCAALGACGTLSRPVLVRSDAAAATSTADHAALLGAEPMLPMLWAWSATRQTTPDAALATLERGRSFQPGDSQLLQMQLSLLAQMARFEDLIEVAGAGLAAGRPTELAVELHWWLVLARIEQGLLEEAEQEIVRLGGVRGIPPDRIAAAWARLAAAHEFIGAPERADAALDRSLDLGPSGLLTLRELGLVEPEQRAAVSALIARAGMRFPEHPDLLLQAVFEELAHGDIAGADAALAALPATLPSRLRRDLDLVHARIDVIADQPERTDRALETLRRRLDDRPDDTLALGVLIECWRLRGKPSDAEMRLRVAWGRTRVQDPVVARQLGALQAELDRRAAP